MKALFHTFGCKLNFAETAAAADVFASKGIAACQPGEAPDIIVVNSCSVTAEADRKCRSAIRAFNRRYPDAIIAVSGCYAQLKPQEVSQLPGVAVVAGVNDKLLLADMVLSAISAGTVTADTSTNDKASKRDAHSWSRADIPDAKDLRTFMPACARGDRTRFFLKVQDGCNYWCTYCTIPRARGRSRSGEIADIVRRAEAAARQGGKEIVITGVNIGEYEDASGRRLVDLCRALDRVEGIQRYRISSIEPNLLTDDLIDFVAASRAFMPHFHIPLQSGSDNVLRLMRRRYDTAFFAAKVARIRNVIPDAFIGVDIIVGARGEGLAEFEASRRFVESLDITHLHVFPYSERPGTRALSIDGIVDQAEKHRRAHILNQISAAKHAAFARRYIGTVRPVLLESSHPGHPMGGFTDNYLRVAVETATIPDNTISLLRLDSLLADGETISASPA